IQLQEGDVLTAYVEGRLNFGSRRQVTSLMSPRVTVSSSYNYSSDDRPLVVNRTELMGLWHGDHQIRVRLGADFQSGTLIVQVNGDIYRQELQGHNHPQGFYRNWDVVVVPLRENLAPGDRVRAYVEVRTPQQGVTDSHEEVVRESYWAAPVIQPVSQGDTGVSVRLGGNVAVGDRERVALWVTVDDNIAGVVELRNGRAGHVERVPVQRYFVSHGEEQSESRALRAGEAVRAYLAPLYGNHENLSRLSDPVVVPRAQNSVVDVAEDIVTPNDRQIPDDELVIQEANNVSEAGGLVARNDEEQRRQDAQRPVQAAAQNDPGQRSVQPEHQGQVNVPLHLARTGSVSVQGPIYIGDRIISVEWRDFHNNYQTKLMEIKVNGERVAYQTLTDQDWRRGHLDVEIAQEATGLSPEDRVQAILHVSPNQNDRVQLIESHILTPNPLAELEKPIVMPPFGGDTEVTIRHRGDYMDKSAILFVNNQEVASENRLDNDGVSVIDLPRGVSFSVGDLVRVEMGARRRAGADLQSSRSDEVRVRLSRQSRGTILSNNLTIQDNNPMAGSGDKGRPGKEAAPDLRDNSQSQKSIRDEEKRPKQIMEQEKNREIIEKKSQLMQKQSEQVSQEESSMVPEGKVFEDHSKEAFDKEVVKNNKQEIVPKEKSMQKDKKQWTPK
ncbi:MAG: hypothetical protein NUV91_08060, partial [Candidatus Omnitrophica bacterium]|nr:hypothetical protein [Candidatus Omnitrophota bacterium]